MADDDNFRQNVMAMYKATGKSATKKAARTVSRTLTKKDTKKIEKVFIDVYSCDSTHALL